jgi:hypothetical protein
MRQAGNSGQKNARRNVRRWHDPEVYDPEVYDPEVFGTAANSSVM